MENTPPTNTIIIKVDKKIKKMNWSIQNAWNDSIVIPSKKKSEPREVLYASEIGRCYYETYLSMMGIEPTNEISNTIRRKMEAGNFYESIVVWVLQRCGALREQQLSVVLEKEGLLPIRGRADILADWIS